MAFDDRIRAALDRALADVRAAVQAEVDEVRQVSERASADLRDSAARLADCVHAIDAAPTLGGVLTVVSGYARLEAGRAAVILVKDGAVSTYPFRDEVPAAEARLARDAATQRRAVIDIDGAAFPIAVGGDVVAVVCTAPPSSPQMRTGLDLLSRHAGCVLEAMTIRQITGLAPLAVAGDPRA